MPQSSQSYPTAVSPKPSLHARIPSYPNNAVAGPSRPSAAFPLSHSAASVVPRPIRKPRKIFYLFVTFFLLYWFGIRHGLGIERIPPPLGFAAGGGRRGRKSSLIWGKKGIAVLNPNPLVTRQEHPIYELMEKAEERWENLLASQSTTLVGAVAEYKKRYGMSPPKGFDDWYQFCKDNNVKIIDNYDQMMKDLLPHHALPPALYLQRSKELEGTKFTYTMDVNKERAELTGERAWSARPRHIKGLIEGFKHALPDGFGLKMTGSDHDTGSVILGKDQRERAMQLVKQKKREPTTSSSAGCHF